MRTIFFIEKELFSREGGFFSYRLVKTLQKNRTPFLLCQNGKTVRRFWILFFAS